MPAIIVNHQVADFATWLKAYEEHAATRSAAGATGSIVFQDINDPNNVTVYIEVDSLEHAREFSQSEDLKQTMQRSGVVSPPTIKFQSTSRPYPN